MGGHNLSVDTRAERPALAFDVCGSLACRSVSIELSDDDTYKVSSYQDKKSNGLIKQYDGVYVEQLHERLSDLTKLRVA